MAQKKITDLQLADAFTVDLNLPVDDGIQTYRSTGQQVADLMIPFYNKGIGLIKNGAIQAVASAGALTIALKQADGSTDPTTGMSKTEIGVRSPTLTSGAQVLREVTAAMSVVIPSGATLGFASAQDHKFFVYFYWDGTNQGLAVSSRKVDETRLYSTVAVDTASDYGDVVYSTAARTGAALRLIGEVGIDAMTTAGTWTTPTYVSTLERFYQPRFKTVTTTYTAELTNDWIKCNASGGAFTLTLPTAVGCRGKEYFFEKIGTDFNIVSVDGAGSETVDGILTEKLWYPGAKLAIISDGANWVAKTAPGIWAEYNSNAGQGFGTGSTVIMNWEDVVLDPYSAVTIGASWKFTAPKSRTYQVTGNLLFGSSAAWDEGETVEIFVYKGGTVVRTVAWMRMQNSPASATPFVSWSFTIALAAGEYIDIRANQDAGDTRTLSATAQYQNIQIRSVA